MPSHVAGTPQPRRLRGAVAYRQAGRSRTPAPGDGKRLGVAQPPVSLRPRPLEELAYRRNNLGGPVERLAERSPLVSLHH